MKVDSQFSGTERYGVESSTFKMELSAHAVEILTKKVYTDIPRAIVRELVFNGVDACVKARTKDPVEVYLPTDSNPSLVIEDFGCGMSPREIDEVYKVFFKSSKQNNNREVGMMGLGAKTPFAYTDQFTLSTCKNGRKRSYVIFLNESGIPDISEVGDESCDRSGTRVEMPVKRKDFDDFYRAMIKTMMFMKNPPVIKRGEDVLLATYKNTHRIGGADPLAAMKFEMTEWQNDLIWGEISPDTTMGETMNMFGGSSYGVIMGDIYYQVDSSVINQDGMKDLMMYPTPNGSYREEKVIRLNIGDVDIQTSREALNYTDKTKKVLRSKFIETYLEDEKKFLSMPKGKMRETLGSMKSSRSFFLIKDKTPDAQKKIADVAAEVAQIKNLHLWTASYGTKNDFGKYSETFLAISNGRNPSDNVASLMKNVFGNKKIKSIVILDQRELEKLVNRQSSRIPPYMQERINLLGIGEYVLVGEAGANVIAKYLGGMKTVHFADLKVPKEKTSAPRAVAVSHAGEPEFRVIDGMKTMTYEDLIEKLDDGDFDKVVYEVYTGTVDNDCTKTCWNEVIDLAFVKAGRTKKDEVDKVVNTSRGWNSMIDNRRSVLNNKLSRFQLKMDEEKVISVAIRFQPFMKLQLWNDPRFVQYTDYFKPLFVEAVTEIGKIDWSKDIKGRHYFDRGYAENVLNYSFVKNSKKFKTTKIYDLLNASANDPGTKDVIELNTDKRYLGEIQSLSERLWGRDKIAEINVVLGEALEKIRHVCEKSVPRSDDMMDGYPMLKHMGTRLTHLNSDVWKDVVDYVEAV